MTFPTGRLRPIVLSLAMLAAAPALAAPAPAETLEPAQAAGLALGDAPGIAYYTVERDGFHVVATLAPQGEDAVPLRVEATLAPGQSVVLSAPRAAGLPAEALVIARRADTVTVRRAGTAVAD